MEYLELGEVFKINIDNKMIYLKVEADNSEYICEECYFELNGGCIELGKVLCSRNNRKDNTNVIYKQVNTIQIVFIVFIERLDKSIGRIGIYPTEENAKKKVEELNKHHFGFAHYYYEAEEYYPYGIINDIKEIKL